MFHKPMNIIFSQFETVCQILTHLFCPWTVWSAKYV